MRTEDAASAPHPSAAAMSHSRQPAAGRKPRGVSLTVNPDLNIFSIGVCRRAQRAASQQSGVPQDSRAPTPDSSPQEE